MSKAIYLGGPMTGLPQFNFPAFDAAARHLRSLGHTVMSPAELDDPATREAAFLSCDGALTDGHCNGNTWGDFLSRDVKLIADACEAICFLPGWQRSRGARLEAFVGLLTGYKFFDYDTRLGLVEINRFDVLNEIYRSMTQPQLTLAKPRKSQ